MSDTLGHPGGGALQKDLEAIHKQWLQWVCVLQAPRTLWSLVPICASYALLCLSLPDMQSNVTCFEDQPNNMNYFPRVGQPAP